MSMTWDRLPLDTHAGSARPSKGCFVVHDAENARSRWSSSRLAAVLALVCFCVSGCGPTETTVENARSALTPAPTDAPPARPTEIPVPTEPLEDLARRLGETFDERQEAITDGLAFFKPGPQFGTRPDQNPPVDHPDFVPPARILEELDPFLDAFQSLVRHPEYSLERLAGSSVPDAGGETRPGRMRIVATASRLMRLRVIDLVRRGAREHAMHAASDCFRATRTAPSSSALGLYFCSLLVSPATNAGMISLEGVMDKVLAGEDAPETVLEDFERIVMPPIHDCDRTVVSILEAYPEGTNDSSMTGSPEADPDLAWFHVHGGVPPSPMELSEGLKVGRIHLERIRNYPTSIRRWAGQSRRVIVTD